MILSSWTVHVRALALQAGQGVHAVGIFLLPCLAFLPAPLLPTRPPSCLQLDAVLARCEEEHEGAGLGGDGSFALDDAHAKALAALPQCRNDGGWAVVGGGWVRGWAGWVGISTRKEGAAAAFRVRRIRSTRRRRRRRCRPADQFQLLRQQLFANSDFWPSGPYCFDDEEEQQPAGGGQQGSGVPGDDGWVHYDTSNWQPPAGRR